MRVRLFKSEAALRKDAPRATGAGQGVEVQSRTPSNLDARKHRSISMPLWATVLLLGLAIGALTWPALQKELLQLGAAPPSPVALPNFGDVSQVSMTYAALPASSAVLISNFEGGDNWSGSGIDRTDPSPPFEGQGSLHLDSVNNVPARVTLSKRLNLSSISLLEMYVRVSDSSRVGMLNVAFLSHASENTGFEFPFTQLPSNTIMNSWFPMRMPREQFEAFGGANSATWSDIGSVRVTLSARPQSRVKATIDLLRGEGPLASYMADWKAADLQYFGIIPSVRGPRLLFRNVAGSFAAMSRVGDAKDFMLTAEVTPITPGRAGLFLRGGLDESRGYSFVIGGLGTSTWQLMETNENRTRILKEGTIQNVTFRGDTSYWLRATTNGDRMTLALSRDGNTFIRVAVIADLRFAFGEVGLSAWDSAAFIAHNVEYIRK